MSLSLYKSVLNCVFPKDLLRYFHLVDVQSHDIAVCSGQFRKHIHHKFLIGLIITQILLTKPFQMLILSCGQSSPSLIDDVSKSGVAHPFLYVMSLPLVREILADFNALESLIDPVV